MQQGFVNVNNVPTRVITWGKWIEDKFSPEESSKDLIICIPGNPGIAKFYTVFLQTIYEKLGYPIWVVGHAGHEVPNHKGVNMPPLKGNEELFNLEGQVQHKVKFFEQYVPENVRIHMIGHSIGAYIILKLLKEEQIRKRVVKNYLMFPTIEYMAETQNGKFLLRVIPQIARILIFLSAFFMILPTVIQNFLLYIYLKITCAPKMHLNTIKCLINPYVLENVFAMGKDEMDNVKQRDDVSIKANKSVLKFYYGATDGWTPVSYYEQIKVDHSGIDAELCARNFEHAFVLKNSRPVGNMVAEWISGI